MACSSMKLGYSLGIARRPRRAVSYAEHDVVSFGVRRLRLAMEPKIDAIKGDVGVGKAHNIHEMHRITDFAGIELAVTDDEDNSTEMFKRPLHHTYQKERRDLIMWCYPVTLYCPVASEFSHARG